MMDNHKFTIIKEILVHLRDGKEKTIFSIHDKYRLSPAEIIDALSVLECVGIVDINPPIVKLRDNYDDFTCEELKKYYFSAKPDLKAKDSDCQIVKKIQINEPCLPEKRLLNKNFFEN
jgi:hypothetical protein